MAEKTGIAWCDRTFNPWIGCTKVSEGCAHCYAEAQNKRYRWVDQWGPQGTRRRTSAENWKKVERWNAEKWLECECGWRGPHKDTMEMTTRMNGYFRSCTNVECKGKANSTRQRVFVGSLMDVFEDRPELVEWRDDLLDLVVRCANLDFLFLTKRPENALPMTREWAWPKNIWMGTTVENQEQVKRLIPLLETPAPVHFLSVEPMLEQVYLGFPAWLNLKPDMWVICGGESGAGCRPMEIEWARDLLAQCRTANVPFFMKQLGGHPRKRHDMADLPEDLRVREFPDLSPGPLPEGRGVWRSER